MTETETAAAATTDRVTRWTIDLTGHQHRSLRMLCASEGTTLAALTRRLWGQAIREHNAGPAPVPDAVVEALAVRDRQWQAFLAGAGPRPTAGG